MALVNIESDRPGVIAEGNHAMSVLTGCESSQLVGCSLDELTVGDDVGVDADLLEQLLAGRIPSYEVAKRFMRADGDVFWGELSVSLIRADDEARRPRYLVVQVADITERKRIEEALLASRDRLASVFDEAPMGMAVTTLDGRWLQVNDALCEMLGYGEAKLFTRRLRELVAPDEFETVQRYLRQLLAGEVLRYHVETRAVRVDREEIWVQLSASLLHDDEGGPCGVLVEVQDISERKRVEEELEQGLLVDATTGLPSRALLFDRLEQAVRRLERSGTSFAVMFAAADGFDEVATRFGRERADRGLRDLSARMLAAVRSGDTVARYSSDEFVVVCEDLESHDEAHAIAERIVRSAQLRIGDGKPRAEVGVTVGVTVAADPKDSPAGLVERADAALYAARSERMRYREYCKSL
jgi:PAS domain S-box-containing protein/diguanylate cyclase (GGDEF)-like protein